MTYQEMQLKLKAWFETGSAYRLIVENTSDMVCILDLNGRVIYCSAPQCKIIKAVPELFQQYLECVHSEHKPEVQEVFERVINFRKPQTIEYQCRDAAAGWTWVESTCIPVTAEEQHVQYLIVASRDITKRKLAEENYRHMAFHDPLTGAPNRWLFKEHLIYSLACAKEYNHLLAVLFLDIDDFKQINDTMGHDTGDEFLKRFVERLKSCIREADSIARMGGDEFIVLLPSVHSAKCVHMVANRIYDALKKPWIIGEYRFFSTVSMGIAIWPGDGEDVATLLKNADQALYQVKRKGGNSYQLHITRTGFSESNSRS